MKSAKTYIDRDELIDFLKEQFIPNDVDHKLSEREKGWLEAIMHVLEEVESLI